MIFHLDHLGKQILKLRKRIFTHCCSFVQFITYCFNEIFVLAKVWGSQLMEGCLIHLYSQGGFSGGHCVDSSDLACSSISVTLVLPGFMFQRFLCCKQFSVVAVFKMPNVIWIIQLPQEIHSTTTIFFIVTISHILE